MQFSNCEGAELSHLVQITIADADQVQQPIQAQRGNRLRRALPHQRFRAIGDTHAGYLQHWDIVGAVANGDYLL